MKTAVIGAGSWGTTFAKVVADAGNPVTVWARKPEVAAEITEAHTNATYLDGIRLPDLVTATSEIGEAVRGAGVVVLAVPAQSLRDNLEVLRDDLEPGAILVSLMKGVELDTGKRMSQVIAEVTGASAENIVVVSGPNLAREIAAEQPTATVVACPNWRSAEVVAELSANSYFRPYTNADVVGVELGGAIKNVIALSVGMADGQGLGDNSKASIITRGLAETSRLALAMGAQEHTLSGLAGLGDLVATCASPLSRNRTFGRLLGEGLSVAEAAEKTSQIAEGVKSSRAIAELGAEYEVDLPITQSVVAVLDGSLPIEKLASVLLSRKRKDESPRR